MPQQPAGPPPLPNLIQGGGTGRCVGATPQPTPAMGSSQQATSTTSNKSAPASTETLATDTAPPGSNSAVIMSDVLELSQKGGTQKSKGKPYCYRCHTKGHTISVCTAVLSCELCFGDHVKKYVQI